jgi:hypothetical protein
LAYTPPDQRPFLLPRREIFRKYRDASVGQRRYQDEIGRWISVEEIVPVIFVGDEGTKLDEHWRSFFSHSEK